MVIAVVVVLVSGIISTTNVYVNLDIFLLMMMYLTVSKVYLLDRMF